LKGVVVKSHGNADTQEFLRALQLAGQYVAKRLPEMIEQEL
jgi:fatty acid/phospholipid biosynthesis enzyme